MEPSDILDRLAKREGNRWGIGTAAVYLRQVEEAVKGSMSEERWRKSLAEAETKLTYCSEGMAPCDFDADIEPSVGFETVPVKHMGETIHLALPCATKKRQATPDAIMEFDAIVTSSKVDRDHDILEPKGASIDPMLPLLWQHTSWEPIGKLVDVLVQNAKRIKARFAIADTMLGRDALVLVEFGALRISHGFSPTDWEERRDKKTDEWLGYHILKYEVYEVSLVSVPSNTDAIITAFSAEKLHHPQVKEWAKGFHDARPVQGRGTDLGLSQTAGEILDEFPDGVVTLLDGAPMPEAEGLQTNNPGFPGYRSGGWTFVAGGSLRVEF